MTHTHTHTLTDCACAPVCIPLQAQAPTLPQPQPKQTWHGVCCEPTHHSAHCGHQTAHTSGLDTGPWTHRKNHAQGSHKMHADCTTHPRGPRLPHTHPFNPPPHTPHAQCCSCSCMGVTNEAQAAARGCSHPGYQLFCPRRQYNAGSASVCILTETHQASHWGRRDPQAAACSEHTPADSQRQLAA